MSQEKAVEVLNPDELVTPRGFNHGLAVEGGRTVYLAGQDATGPDGGIIEGDIVDQFKRVMENLSAVIEEAGGGSSDIVKLNVYVADREEYRANLGNIGEVFARYVDDYPAMALFEVSGFFKTDARIELEGFAVIEDGEEDQR
jgi:enamine deaminase RidA (YjgF/YER057c/UK114 family)